jgi:serine phosphatase RsbU (regulator of sigma subunit)/Tfp pilus assembly protein PilF
MRKLLAVILVLILNCTVFYSQNNIDSLRVQLSVTKDSAQLKTYLAVGNYFYNKGQLDTSLSYFKIGLSKATELKREKHICDFLLRLGLLEREKGVYNKSSEYYYKALEIAEKNDFKKQKASIYNGIAVLAAIQKEPEKAIEFYTKSLEIYKEIGFLAGQGSIYNNIGLSYLDKGNNTTALKFFFKALEISNKMQDEFNIAVNCENIGLTYHELKNDNLALIYYSKALKIWYSREDEYSIPISLGYMAKTFTRQKKWNRAIDTAQKAMKFAVKVNSIASQRDMALQLSEAYEGSGDIVNSFKYFKLGKSLSDSLQNNDKTKEITEIQLNYTFNKIKVRDSIKHELEVKVKETQLATEKNYKYIVSAVLVLILLLLFFVFKNYKEKKKANEVITFQKDLVEKKQKEILDSITYARRIQTALLSQDEVINNYIKDHFHFFKPKDIVSGDFYWVAKKGDLLYFAVCDSTGHGVPGAFMSLLNINFLNEAINENNITKPNEIFNYVRSKLIDSISKEGQQDGFDGILLCIDTVTKEITYSAANNKPLLVSDKEMKQLETDKMPVGKSIKEGLFRSFSLKLGSDQTLYLFTDGYADQFGGPKGKKFKLNELNKLLCSISHLSMKDQEQKLKEQFDNWKGKLEQVDDVLIVGIRF